MRITINNNKSNEVDKFTESELKFLQILELDEKFDRRIRKIRERFKIPLEGLNRKDLKRIEAVEKKLTIDIFTWVWHLVFLYNLPKYWFSTFYSIVFYNEADLPDKSGLDSQPVSIELEEGFIKITVRENISKRFLKNIIDNNDLLTKYLLKLPISPKIKSSNIAIKKRMLELRRENMKYDQIAKKLEEEFGEKLPFNPDYDITNAEGVRFDNLLKNTLQKNWITAADKTQIMDKNIKNIIRQMDKLSRTTFKKLKNNFKG